MNELDVVMEKDTDLRRQIRRVNLILLVVLAVLIIAPATLSWWVARQLPVVSTVSIDNVQMLSPAELCPGDPLIYSYQFHAGGSGVLIRDRVLWRLSPPPKTMIYSVSRRFILMEAIDQELTETWHVPGQFLNPETDRTEPIPPGDYRMIFAISSPSRSTVVAISGVDFTLKEDCYD